MANYGRELRMGVDLRRKEKIEKKKLDIQRKTGKETSELICRSIHH